MIDFTNISNIMNSFQKEREKAIKMLTQEVNKVKELEKISKLNIENLVKGLLNGDLEINRKSNGWDCEKSKIKFKEIEEYYSDEIRIDFDTYRLMIWTKEDNLIEINYQKIIEIDIVKDTDKKKVYVEIRCDGFFVSLEFERIWNYDK